VVCAANGFVTLSEVSVVPVFCVLVLR